MLHGTLRCGDHPRWTDGPPVSLFQFLSPCRRDLRQRCIHNLLSAHVGPRRQLHLGLVHRNPPLPRRLRRLRAPDRPLHLGGRLLHRRQPRDDLRRRARWDQRLLSSRGRALRLRRPLLRRRLRPRRDGDAALPEQLRRGRGALHDRSRLLRLRVSSRRGRRAPLLERSGRLRALRHHRRRVRCQRGLLRLVTLCPRLLWSGDL
jgi:hypothetical protein